MGRPKSRATDNMRVPIRFKSKIFELSKKYGYKDATHFMDKDGFKIFDNADQLNDFFGVFFRRKKRK